MDCFFGNNQNCTDFSKLTTRRKKKSKIKNNYYEINFCSCATLLIKILILIITFIITKIIFPDNINRHHLQERKTKNYFSNNSTENITEQNNNSFVVYQLKLESKNYFCYNCMKNISNLSSKCFNCSDEILFKNLYVASRFETLDVIIKYNKSISRYGDGEYNLIFGISHYFQRISEKLGNRLSEILNNNEEKCLIGIYYPYKKEELDLYTDNEAN